MYNVPCPPDTILEEHPFFPRAKAQLKYNISTALTLTISPQQYVSRCEICESLGDSFLCGLNNESTCVHVLFIQKSVQQKCFSP